MSKELKPCPFCGQPGFVHSADSIGAGFYVACTSIECFCAVGEAYDSYTMPSHCFQSEEQAIEAWNKRAPEQPKSK